MRPNLLTLTAILALTAPLHFAAAQTDTTQTTTTQTPAALAADARALADKARATYPRGSANIDQTLWKQAAAAAEAAVAAAPGNPEYLKLRANIYTEVGFWKQAETTWTAYFQAAPNAAQNTPEAKSAATVQYNLGYAAYTRNQPDQAAKFFDTCLTFDPASAPAPPGPPAPPWKPGSTRWPAPSTTAR